MSNIYFDLNHYSIRGNQRISECEGKAKVLEEIILKVNKVVNFYNG